MVDILHIFSFILYTEQQKNNLHISKMNISMFSPKKSLQVWLFTNLSEITLLDKRQWEHDAFYYNFLFL
jgi:hypothetical protein